MLKLQHSIRKQTIRIEAESESLALALQPRVSDINRQYFLPVIERLFDEVSVPDRHVEIARLNVDLGDLPLDGFEETAAERLERELRRALRAALYDNQTARHRSRSEQTSHLELLEHYLLQGTLPFWAPRMQVFKFEESLLQLIATDPAALVDVLRKHGHQVRLRERLVLQLGEAALQRLLQVLEPAHAALIIAYLIDLRRIHRVEPVLVVRDKEFSDMLWLLTLSYLLEKHGSQFNRKSFVKRILQAMAMSGDLEYAEILAVVHHGLQETGKKHRLESSLLGVIAELIKEGGLHKNPKNPALTQMSDALANLHFYLTIQETECEAWPEQPARRELFRYLITNDAASTRQLIVDLAHRSKLGPSRMAHRLLQAFRPDVLLAALAYGERDFITRLIAVVSSASPQSHALADLLWQTLIEYLLVNPTSRWNRRVIVRQVVEKAAEYLSLYPGSLANTLARELGESAGTVERLLARSLEKVGRTFDYRSHSVRSFFARYDRIEVLRYYFRYGILPWNAVLRNPNLTVDGAIGFLPVLSRSQLSLVFARNHPDETLRTLLHAVRIMSEERLAQLLQRLHPQLREADSNFRSSLSEFGTHVKEKHVFYARLIAAVLHGDPLDLEEFAVAEVDQLDASEPSLPSDPAEWDGHILKSVIIHRLRFGNTSSAGEHSTAVLMHMLVKNYPEDARHFSRALQKSPDLVTALIAQAGTTLSLPDEDRQSPVIDPEAVALLNREPGDESQKKALSDDALQHALIIALEDYPEEIYTLVAGQAKDPRRRDYWTNALSEPALARLTYLLEPHLHRNFRDACELLVSAWLETTSTSALAGRRLFWGFLLEFLALTTRANRSVEGLVAAFFAHVASRHKTASSDSLQLGTKMLKQADQLAVATGHARLHHVLQYHRSELLSPWESSASQVVKSEERIQHPHRDNRKTAFSMLVEHQDDEAVETIYIDNAGLVLTGAFLSHFFQTLDLLDHDTSNRPQLRDRHAVSRAVHLLQYLVDGRTSAPEALLVLNKILCGVAVKIPIAAEIEPTDHEKEICERLLKAMIENWKSISNTSIAGLQETFLRREGKLERSGEGWKLRVQRKTVDVLVDQVPWSISVIYHRWMPQPLHVEW